VSLRLVNLHCTGEGSNTGRQPLSPSCLEQVRRVAVAGTNIRFTGAFALWLFSRHAHLVEPGDWNARLIEDVVQVRNVVLAAAFIALGKDYSLRRA
jgi:hypothetical protein